MTDAGGRKVLTTWASHLAASLVQAGVENVVVSPGSRSTPFLLALHRHPALRLHPVIDERAAAFFALGLVRTTARPVALLCTSGSAPAHYAPAVLEASEAGLPLVVLSADRPSRLAHSGAPQTTDQTRLYGRHTRFFADLGDPSEYGVRAMQRSVATAVSRARGPRPGPVQINARADKPLEPDPNVTPVADGGPRVTPSRLAAASDDAVDRIARVLRGAERPAVIAGPMGFEARALRPVVEQLVARGVALYAECTSQLRLGFPGALRLEALDLWIHDTAPDAILEIGATATSAPYLRWVAQADVRRVVLATHPRDPSANADEIVVADVPSTLQRLAERLDRKPHAGWAASIQARETRAWAAVDEALTPWGEAQALRIVAHALPDEALLALGNSLPIRHADRALRATDTNATVLSQRGVNGIDGWVAGATGAAVGSGLPVVCVIGDVTLAHDASSLALARGVTTPLVFVVLDNAGGRIFERLPIAHVADDEAMALFRTPPELNMRALAGAYGVQFDEAEDTQRARQTLDEALSVNGPTLLRWVVPPDGAERVEAQIRDALA
ncbi:MAG: 2-succinyl-5-enolpyruvyl-6-hydroxy-3-cyclohexene-1-carboxylic-acid synthase [Sandaracinaceae bacterium]